jgi:hypothetical protein
MGLLQPVFDGIGRGSVFVGTLARNADELAVRFVLGNVVAKALTVSLTAQHVGINLVLFQCIEDLEATGVIARDGNYGTAVVLAAMTEVRIALVLVTELDGTIDIMRGQGLGCLGTVRDECENQQE